MQLTIIPFVAVVVISWAAVPALTHAAETPAGAGLWPANYTPESTDCGAFGADGQGFCVADDSLLGVELGVKFYASKPVLITGVRIYRVDLVTQGVTGSLWDASGDLVRTGAFAGSQSGNSWADLVFYGEDGEPEPFLIDAFDVGVTFVASYFSPQARYAFEYDFFSDFPEGFTMGPITARQSLPGDGNGVFCYSYQSCFPSDSFPFPSESGGTNYWVTPLWAYSFDGFYSPVDIGIWNKSKAGRAIPVKFSLGDDLGLDILKPGYPKAWPVACPGNDEPTHPIEETTIATAGGGSLTYDADADQYVFVWKTSKQWAGNCYKFDLGLNDDTSHTFGVAFSR